MAKSIAQKKLLGNKKRNRLFNVSHEMEWFITFCLAKSGRYYFFRLRIHYVIVLFISSCIAVSLAFFV